MTEVRAAHYRDAVKVEGSLRGADARWIDFGLPPAVSDRQTVYLAPALTAWWVRGRNARYVELDARRDLPMDVLLELIKPNSMTTGERVIVIF